MNFRATSGASAQQAIRYLGRYNANILKYQKQISSGLRLDRQSEDPVSFRAITSLSARLEELRAETFSIKDAQTKLNVSVSQLTETNQLLTSAKGLAQQGVQALSQGERDALAIEAEGLLNSLKSISLTQSSGAYIYGGTRSNVVPFEFSDPATLGGTLQVNYQGAVNNSRAHIGESVSLDTYYAGDEVFGNPNRGDTILLGTTGAQTTSATDNLIGRVQLQVRHTTTTYAAGSGLAAGTRSANEDTVLGPTGRHQVTVIDTAGDGSAGTISLNGAAPVAFTSADTNLEVIGINGEKIFVDTSSITAGFNGTVDLQADGTLSVDGGESSVAIDFSASQTVTDAASGQFVRIDSQAINRTGDDYLEFPGTSDVFQAVYELVQDLRNTRGLNSAQIGESLNRRLGELDSLANHVLDTMGYQAASLQTLQQLDGRVGDLALETETQLNNLQATDVPSTVLRMQNDKTLLEYTYAITAQINSVSIIDFLN